MRRLVYTAVFALCTALLVVLMTFSGGAAAAEGFGIGVFENLVLERNGQPTFQAGVHPYEMKTTFTVNVTTDPGGALVPAGNVKNADVELPAGLVGNPDAVPKCGQESFSRNACPNDTAVGVAELELNGGHTALEHVPVFNLVPTAGTPAELGFAPSGARVYITTSVRSGLDYGVTASVNGVNSSIGLIRSTVVLWGVPGEVGHDGERGHCLNGGGSCPFEGAPRPFLSAPTSCQGPLTTRLRLESWEEPGEPSLSAESSSVFENSLGSPYGFDGCDLPGFDPSISLTPQSSTADSPTGLDVELRLPQNERPEGLAEADLKDAVVTLPAGLTVNPSSANGLEACSPAEIGLESAPGVTPAVFSGAQAECPAASQIGTVEIDTPLLEHPLDGSVYLAAQEQNPFGSLLAIYISVHDPVSGVVVKLGGHVEIGEEGVTNGLAPGQLRTSVMESPQLPFEAFKLDFFNGALAALVTPSTCGTFSSTAMLTPWTSPEEPDVNLSSAFAIDSAPDGLSCVASEAAQPNHPVFTVGTSSNQAGAFSPLEVSAYRADGEQTLGEIDVTTPPGLLAIVKNVVQCAEPQASAGGCGSESLIGEASAAAGAGADPYWVKGGRVYLTGPYNHGPFGLSIVVPAVAGPFNLGQVIVRASIRVNAHTGQITVVSDPLPKSLKGIPLQIRAVNVAINRPDFAFNPTNCSQLYASASITSTAGNTYNTTVPFEAANCGTLAYKPSFTASTNGKASKADGANLQLKITPGAAQANTAKLKLVFPKQLPTRLPTLQKACVAAVFEVNPASCPGASAIGSATVDTPLLTHPLAGPIYLVSYGGAKFPDTILVLQGEGITLEVVGDTDIKNGITTSTFETVPDAPFTSFEGNLPQGPYSAFGTYLPVTDKYSFCGQTLTIPTTFIAQNGATFKQETKITVKGCPKKKQSKKPGKKSKKKKK